MMEIKKTESGSHYIKCPICLKLAPVIEISDSVGGYITIVCKNCNNEHTITIRFGDIVLSKSLN